MNLFLSNLLGTLKNTFRINKLTIDASGLTVPRTIVMPDKAGTLAMLSDITAGSVQPVNLSLNSTAVGTTPRLVSSLKLAPGTYSAKAYLGSNSYGNTAYLVIRKGSIILATISRSGYLNWVNAPATFTLESLSDVTIYIYGASRSSYSYVRGLQLS